MNNMNLCYEVIRIINRWKPKDKYPRVKGYRDDLKDFIENEFLKSQQKPFGSKKHTPTEKRGSIEIDRTIRIALKRNLNGKNGIDTLIGQIDEYERAYPCVIIVLCGEMSDETAEDTKDRINRRFGGMGSFGQPRKFQVIRKDEAALKKAKKTPPTLYSPKIF